jgi:hypothetical protein
MLAVVIILNVMTDLEKLEKTFTEIGVKFEKKTAKEEIDEEIKTVAYDGEVRYDTMLKLENGIGYYSFICELYFLEGKYQNHGCWQ